MKFPKKPGVYCFWNKVSNKVYVGSSVCLFTRINNHLKNQQSNKHLQNAIRHYGIGSNAKVRYALEVNSSALLHTFKSSYEAAKFTNVPRSNISVDDLKAKFFILLMSLKSKDIKLIQVI